MQLKRRDVLTGLRKLGEVFQGSKHQKCKVVVGGKKVRTFPIPGNPDFDDALIGMVAKPLCLKNRPFVDVCDCTKDAQWYEGYLESEGLL